MPTASETTDTSLYDSMLCMTAVSLEMSDEPVFLTYIRNSFAPNTLKFGAFDAHCKIGMSNPQEIHKEL